MSAAPHHVERNRAALEPEETILNAPPVEHDKEDAQRDEDGGKREPRKIRLFPVNVASDNQQDKQGQCKTCETPIVSDAENASLRVGTQLREHDGAFACAHECCPDAENETVGVKLEVSPVAQRALTVSGHRWIGCRIWHAVRCGN